MVSCSQAVAVISLVTVTVAVWPLSQLVSGQGLAYMQGHLHYWS